MSNSPVPIERRFIQTRSCRLHIAISGEGFPVLLLHQTPRSWDEYREALPRLGRHYRAIAMDTAGFGDSEPLPSGEESIESWAAAAHELLDELGLTRVALVGHHTGAAIAIEMAASQPARVKALVLSASPYVDAAARVNYVGRRIIDSAERQADGGHLVKLWNMRKQLYPEDDIALLERFMIDALKAGERAVNGHRAVRRYMMEDRLPLISCATLVIAPTADADAYQNARRVADAIRGSELVEIEGGMVPLPNQMPDRFAQTVDDFLAHALTGSLEPARVGDLRL